MLQRYKVTFLNDKVTDEEVSKISALIDHANKIILEYFGMVTSFDILICQGSWEMEVQVVSRRNDRHRYPQQQRSKALANNNSNYYDSRFIGLTDYRLEEIVIRSDVARFGHYLHELIHGIIPKDYPHQLREGLAWYFTLKLTQKHRYLRPQYPSWVSRIYIQPTVHLAEIVGDDFLKDLAVGKASVAYGLLPVDVQELFEAEEVFYPKKRPSDNTDNDNL